MKERKTIYELNLFEAVEISKDESIIEVIKRVPGGWLYIISPFTSDETLVFIPFNNEFKSDSGINDIKFKVTKRWTSVGVKEKGKRKN